MYERLIIWGITILGLLPGLFLAGVTLALIPWRLIPWRRPRLTPTLGAPDRSTHLVRLESSKFGVTLIDPPLWAAALIVIGAACVVAGLAFQFYVPDGIINLP